MLTTKEAAEYLGVTEGRIRQLILAGKLVAEKTSNGWLVSESSLFVRKGAAKVGRPKKGQNTQVDSYTLMSRDYEVARIAYDQGMGAFTRVEVLDSARAPLALVNYEAQNGHTLRNLNAWWGSRAIPNTRPEIVTRLHELQLYDTREIPLRSLGFSLSDQYWVKPEGSGLQWKDLNFFHNAYDFGPVDGKDSLSIWLNAVGLNSPDNTSDGQLPKRWLVNDKGKRILIKSGGSSGREAINEVVASRLYKRLLPEHEYVTYSLGRWRDKLVSVCETFVTDREEFIPAVCVYDLCKKPNSVSQYQHYFDTCAELGVLEAADMLDKMIVCDCILANEDRHWRNFGIIRDVETLRLHPAPIFDSGTSLWSSVPDDVLERHDFRFTTKPFYERWDRQLDLVAYSSWFDPDALDGFVDEVHDIYMRQLKHHSWLVDLICSGLEERIGFAKSWYARMPHQVFTGWAGKGPQETVTYIDL